ncbi:MAG: endonuclease [Candidatus Cloacimonetes bacterium]|nr:endonuclease [Candidatus Cloacimonadota bacterium]
MKYYICSLLLILSAALAADPPEGYYDGTEGLMGTQLHTALHDIIDDHVEHSYNALRDYILPYTDQDTLNSDNVILLYTGWSLPIADFGGAVSEWNREHVWAKSHGGFDNDPPCGTDAHHIRPTDVSVNARRGNLDFDEGGNLYIDPDGDTGCYYDSDSWEPRDEVKGDVARMIFYMDVRYEGDSGELDLEMVDEVNTSPAPEFGKMSTLLAWHFLDPPDAWEMRRNDRVFEFQENRNPFIDHPEFVSRIWFNTAHDDNVITYAPEISLFPNPFNPSLMLSCYLPQASFLQVKIYNQKGQFIEQIINTDLPAGYWKSSWNSLDLPSGIYFIRFETPGFSQTKKAVLLK